MIAAAGGRKQEPGIAALATMMAAPLAGNPMQRNAASPTVSRLQADQCNISYQLARPRCQPTQLQLLSDPRKRRDTVHAAAAATAAPDEQVETVTGAPLEDAAASKSIRTARVPSFPFVRLAGQDDMKLALMLNVIDSRIGGVLIMGDRGTGKSVAVSIEGLVKCCEIRARELCALRSCLALTHTHAEAAQAPCNRPGRFLQQVQMLMKDMWFSESILAEPYHVR